ncbi:MAG: N-acetylneuraminate lyase [Clostridia bacterium]|nr:N-acetylneuraminate lyase [Clostridia bacterium]
MKDLRGIYTALLTPFDDKGRINEKELSRLVKHNLDLGADGFYVCGSTGEALMLNVNERKQIMKIVKENAENANLIAHIGSISERDAHELAAYAKALDYDLISSVAPFYYKFSFPEIRDYYIRLAENSGMKMLVYHIPVFSGVGMGFDELSSFLKDDRFAGLKFTSNDFFTMERCKAQFPDKIILNGYDEMILSGLSMGADGGIGSTYNFMADKFVLLRRLFSEGKVEEAAKVQSEVNRIIAVLIKIGVMQAEKEIMNQLGFDFGHCLPPFKKVTEEGKKMIAEEVIPFIRKAKA